VRPNDVAGFGHRWNGWAMDDAPPPPLVAGSFGSRHPGVSNFLFADGAVGSVADSIDPATAPPACCCGTVPPGPSSTKRIQWL